MKKLLFCLLSIDTSVGNIDNQEKTLIEIKKYLSPIIKHVYISEISQNNKPSLIISTYKTKELKFVLTGHMDVVPATYDKAFKPYDQDGKIYGRGVMDMKGQNVAMIEAFKEIVESCLESKKKLPDMALIFTNDEEIGGFDGIGYIFNPDGLGYSCEVAFLPDGGKNWKLVTDQKAILQLQVVFTGKSAHGSRPWLGENAIEKAIRFYNYLEGEWNKKYREATVEDRWKPTLNLGVFNGGETTNKVADKAEISLDIRFPVEYTVKELETLVTECAKKFNGTVEKKTYGNAMNIKKQNRWVKSWVKSVEKVTGQRIQFEKEDGASDARHLSNIGVPVIVSMSTGNNHHADNEWIEWQGLVGFKNCIIEWIMSNN